ncbi:MAG: nucleoside deaminase [Clostridia bacterium]|nr:nucleoside deaminase [Clostridia bacterium]
MTRFTQTDAAYMRLALDEAHTAFSEGEIPVGCVIAPSGIKDVSSGQLPPPLARTHNLCEKTKDFTAHAEMLALKSVNRHALRGATVYVTLEPCPMCAGALALSGVSRVIYGASDAQYGCCGSVYRLTEDPAFPSFSPADGGLMKEDCEAILEKGFDRMRK